MRYGNESDISETYCYVRIEQHRANLDNWDLLAYLSDNRNFLCDSPFGIKEAFIDKKNRLQAKSGYMILIFGKRVYYLYNGGLVPGGIVREWSKKPIKPSINKINEYKKIQNEINELKQKQQLLLTK